VIVLAVTPFTTSFMTQWARADVETRSKLVFNLTRENMAALLSQGRTAALVSLFERIAADEKVLAVGFCTSDGRLRYATQLMPKNFTCEKVSRSDTDSFSSVRTGRHDLLIGAFPLASTGGHFVILNDLGFAEERGATIRRYFLAIFMTVVIVALIAAFVVALVTIRGWVNRVRYAFRVGRGSDARAVRA
jgi:trehalose 6-phosphate synthase